MKLKRQGLPSSLLDFASLGTDGHSAFQTPTLTSYWSDWMDETAIWEQEECRDHRNEF
jgi:hypothetical protein